MADSQRSDIVKQPATLWNSGSQTVKISENEMSAMFVIS